MTTVPGVWNRDQLDFDGFGAEVVVATNPDGPRSVVAADLDGDGDHDVLTGWVDGTLAWSRNLFGNGFFGPRIPIAVDADGTVRSIVAADLDGDDDQDVVYAGNRVFAWVENTAAPVASVRHRYSWTSRPGRSVMR